MEWVEVRGKTIEVAVQAAMDELGVEDREWIDVEVMQEPERGFLGLGGKEAVVKVKVRPARSGRRRRRRRGGAGRESRGDERGGAQDRSQPSARDAQPDRRGGQRSGERKSSERGDRESRREGAGSRRSGGNRSASAKADQRDKRGSGGGDGRGRGGRAGTARQGEQRQANGGGGKGPRESSRTTEEAKLVTIEEQMPVVEEFLNGLVGAFGLEGKVDVGRDDDVILADISGSQTEAMVGPRGAVIEAVHELTKTVLQRQTQASARLRLDIAGYGLRRRQALAIYAHQLIDQVVEEGGEIMMEPMSAGDRKVIHDAVAEREGVRSYSEGEAPSRFVVIAATGEAAPGPEGSGEAGAEAGDDAEEE